MWGCRFRARVPDALQRPSRCCAEPGPYQASEPVTAPALQRTATRRATRCAASGARDLGKRAMLTLYFAPGASSMAVHIALHEIGVPFDARPMSFENQDMRASQFLALNPEGKVPVLLIDGRPLTEVAALLCYLARRFPDAEFRPRDDPDC